MISKLKAFWQRLRARFSFRKEEWEVSPERHRVRRITGMITKRRVAQAVYFPVTVLGTSFALWYFLPTWLAGLLMMVILTHEFAHYFTATHLGRTAALPFFVPIPFFGVVGATHVKGHEPETDSKIALAGPFAATLLTIGFMTAFMAAGFMPGFWASFWMLVFQVYSGIFGGDGRRYRRAKREINLSLARPVAEPTLIPV